MATPARSTRSRIVRSLARTFTLALAVAAGASAASAAEDAFRIDASGVTYVDPSGAETRVTTTQPQEYASNEARFVGVFDSGTWVWDVAGRAWSSMSSAKAATLTIDGDLLVVTFAADSGSSAGLWTHDFATSTWKKLSDSVPLEHVLRPGYVLAAFDSPRGLWTYDLATAAWTKLASAVPTTYKFKGKDLLAAFDEAGAKGLWLYEFATASWKTLTNDVPKSFRASGDLLVVTFDNDSIKGLWTYAFSTGAWTELAGDAPLRLDLDAKRIVAAFADGLFVYDLTVGGWERLNDAVAKKVDLQGELLYVTLETDGGTEQWLYDFTTRAWQRQ
jgi:hypothetical protein